MEESRDRWEFISKQLDKLWIDYERIEGTNPKKMTKEEIDKIYDKNLSIKVHPPKWLSLGSIWCSHSHIKIYERIVNEHIPYSLILEDDIIINPKIKWLYDKISNNSDNIKRDYLSMNYWCFSFLYFKNYIKKTWHEKNKKYFLLYLIWWIIYSILDFFPQLLYKITWKILIVKRYRPFYLTWAYFITYDWAKKLLSVHPKVFTTADFLPENYRKKSGLRFFVTVPVLAEQDTKTFETTSGKYFYEDKN